MSEPPSIGTRRWPVERWLLGHNGSVVFAVIAVGLALRVSAIRGNYLGSDEAVHYQIVNVSSLGEVYRASLTNAHPPLFFFLLYFWRLAGTSEIFLRLLPVLFGTAFLAIAHRWTEHLFDRSAALFALAILACSPAVVSLSFEVRGYTLLLLLMAAALLALERAIETRSAVSMAGFSALLYLAILTHYSAVWFTVATFVYALVRVLREHPPARLTATWLGFQVGAAALYAVLYFTHLAALRGSALEQAIRNRADLFYPSQESVFAFLARQTSAIFRALLALPALLGITAAVLGIALLMSRKRPTAVLLALPFLLGAAGGIAALYPYGGTRHCAYLFLFGAAAISVAGSAMTGGRLWPALVLAILLAGFSLRNIAARESNLGDMKAAIQTIRAIAPPDSLLFTDLHTGLTLSYYLGGGDFFRQNPARTHFWRIGGGGYRLMSSQMWVFTANRFQAEFQRFIEEEALRPGQSIWVVHIGREIDAAQILSRRYPGAGLEHTLQFGEIAIAEVRLP